MALSPIKLFQNDQTSLAQILQGDNQTISGIMDRAIQIGRDISNKQMQQEHDLIGMRQQQAALDQRRGEDLQQDYEDTRRFARGVFESDRRYGLETQAAERASARDLFSNKMEEKRFGLSERGQKLGEDKFDYTKAQDTAEAEAAEARARRTAAMFGVGTEPDLPAAETTPKSPLRQMGEAVFGATTVGRVANGISALFGEGREEAPDGSVLPPRGSDRKLPAGVTPEAYAAAEETMRDPKASATDKRIAIDILRPETAESVTEETPAGRRAAESLEMRKRAAAQKAEEDEIKGLVADTAAFVPQVPQAYAKEGATKVDLEMAEVFDKDRVASEIASAQNYSEEDDYVNFKGMTLTPSQKEKRRKLWRYANRSGGTPPAGGGGGSATSRIPGGPPPGI